MPVFSPIRALRFTDRDLASVVSPPYDVLSEEEVESLHARSPDNVTHVDVPTGADDRYANAATTLERWCRDGVLTRDPLEGYTIYRLRFVDSAGDHREIVGVLGGLEVVDEGAGGVLPHERVTKKASTDRLELLRATTTNTSPIWGLGLAPGLTDLLEAPADHVGEVRLDGVTHVVERVTDPDRVAAIRASVEAGEVLIADGHHRYGVAREYRDEQREDGGAVVEGAATTLAFVSELRAEQLAVEAIHRLYSEIAVDELRDALATHFEIETDERLASMSDEEVLREMDARQALVLASPTERAWLRWRPGADPAVRDLDGARLEAALDSVDHSVQYQHGVPETIGAVSSGKASAAVLIRPVSVAEIERTARERLLMPPKSTFFTPKLLTGLVMRPLD